MLDSHNLQITPGQIATLTRLLRQGYRRPEALRKVGIDPIRFAAEYRRSPSLREQIALEEGRPGDLTPIDVPYVAVTGSTRPAAIRADRDADSTSTRAARDLPPALLLLVLIPMAFAIVLLALGGAAAHPALVW